MKHDQTPRPVRGVFFSRMRDASTCRYNRRMNVLLNGETREVAGTCTLAELLASSGYAERRIAVEVNREIVPRSRHGEHRLADGDRIEIVHAIGGG